MPRRLAIRKMPASSANAQVPVPGEINLDHLAHFVPHMESASRALERLGFSLTPLSIQSHRLGPDQPTVPAGAGNRCAMLEHGYLEFLTPLGDTDIASQLRAAQERYVGVHLIAFGSAAPEEDYSRLREEGFCPLEPLALQREIETETGRVTARFAVVRVPPGTMPEGRIQFCQHLTPQWLWQERWIRHPNQARALKGVIVCVSDPHEAGKRFARFTGVPQRALSRGVGLVMGRGYVLFADSRSLARRLHVEPPSLPWIAGYVLESLNLSATAEFLETAGGGPRWLDGGRLLVELPPVLGGMAIFEAENSMMLDLG